MKSSVSKLAVLFTALVISVFGACSSDDSPEPTKIAAIRDATPTPVVSIIDGVTRVVAYLSPVEGEGQIGSATLSSDGITTTVDIDVRPTTSEAQPIHIHSGTCESVGGVVHALENLVNGQSTTVIQEPLDDILVQGVLVNVHASYADASTYTACGQLPVNTR